MINSKIISIFPFLILFFHSCGQRNTVEKPQGLISTENMELILYDLSVMNGIRSSQGRKEIFEPIMNVTYIYKKYKIDSAQLAASDFYYAKNPLQYLRIHRNVEKRLNATIDSLNKSKENKN